MSAAVNPHPRTRYRADLDAELLAAAEALAVAGRRPTTWRLAIELGHPESTVRRHRDSLVARGLWRWEVRAGRPRTCPCHVPSLSSHEARLLTTARDLAAAGEYPSSYKLAALLGISQPYAVTLRARLDGLGLWEWPVKPAPVTRRPEPVGGESTLSSTEAEVRYAAADALCTAFQGQSSPLLDEFAKPWKARPRARPPDPATVAEREAAERRRQIRLLRVEWRKLMRTWVSYRRGVML